ncbi:MAG: hypothetical protein GX119_05105 [Syntrophomonadaceae bacterium]|nr:hypothetical protein [Syntrophomonadaceae bacterium]
MKGQKTVDLLRGIRHDFGNHLQVILGYMDLGSPQQARQYILKLVEEMAAERLIFESTDADTALYLYEQLLLSRELGVILRYDEIKVKSPDLLQLNNEPWRSLQQVLKEWEVENEEDEPMVYLEIYEKSDGVDLLYSCEGMEPDSVIVEVRK